MLRVLTAPTMPHMIELPQGLEQVRHGRQQLLIHACMFASSSK
jgi:hypothetical protein